MFFLVLFSVFVFATNYTVFAAEATLLNKGSTLNASFGDTAPITDGARSTKAVIKGSQNIAIESLHGISSLYFMWDDVPTNWTLSTSDGTVIAMQTPDKFLHEYIEPFKDANGETIFYTNLALSITDGVLCDMYLFAQGDAPAYVQKWQPPYDDADMLLLPTHADDEHLYFGGTMPVYSETRKLQVAYLTNHNGEKYRRHELLDGLWAVGITAYPIISDFQDAYSEGIEHAKRLYPEQAVLEYQVMLLRRFKPEVVIAHDINGEYGHGVHQLNAQTLQKSLEAAADSTQLPQYPDAHSVSKAYFHLMKERPIVMDWSIALPRFGGKTAYEVAKDGYDAHKSQHKWSFAVEDFGLYDCRKFGLYRSTVGDDIAANDFFENISDDMFSDYIAPEPITPQTPVQSEAHESISSEPPTQKQHTEPQTYFMAAGVPLLLAALAIAISKLTKAKK